jgi:hypothetical protein
VHATLRRAHASRPLQRQARRQRNHSLACGPRCIGSHKAEARRRRHRRGERRAATSHPVSGVADAYKRGRPDRTAGDATAADIYQASALPLWPPPPHPPPPPPPCSPPGSSAACRAASACPARRPRHSRRRRRRADYRPSPATRSVTAPGWGTPPPLRPRPPNPLSDSPSPTPSSRLRSVICVTSRAFLPLDEASIQHYFELFVDSPAVSVPTTRLQQNLLILSCVDLIVAYVRRAKTSARSRSELAFSLLQNRTSSPKIYRFDPWEVSRFYPPEATELQPVLSCRSSRSPFPRKTSNSPSGRAIFSLSPSRRRICPRTRTPNSRMPS